MTHKDYNGWTNYETWNVKLWMDNHEFTYHYWQEQTDELWNCARENQAWPGSTRKESAAVQLADTLKSECEENQPEVSGVYADLLGAALSEVNWLEIAENMLEEYPVETEVNANGLL
jgi:hypothetical protein